MMAELCKRHVNVAGRPKGGGETVAGREGDGTSGGLRRFDCIVIRKRTYHLTAGRGAALLPAWPRHPIAGTVIIPLQNQVFRESWLPTPIYRDGIPKGPRLAFRSQFQRCEAKMPDVPENNPLLSGGESVKQLAELNDGGCFEPFTPQVSISSALNPAPKPMPSGMISVVDELFTEWGIPSSPTDTTPETGFPAPTAAESTRDAEIPQPSEILIAQVEASLPTPRIATAVELFT